MEDNPLSLYDIPIIVEKGIAEKIHNVTYNNSAETILIFPGKGEVLVINETASMVWNSIDGVSTIENIVEKLYKNYQLSKSQIQIDVLEFIKQLSQKKIIEIIKSQ